MLSHSVVVGGTATTNAIVAYNLHTKFIRWNWKLVTFRSLRL